MGGPNHFEDQIDDGEVTTLHFVLILSYTFFDFYHSYQPAYPDCQPTWGMRERRDGLKYIKGTG